jgi:two-component system, LytTR family, response regulator
MSALAAGAAPFSFVPTSIRTVIATSGVDAVRAALELDPDIEIVADCNYASQAAAAVREFVPDLLIIDSHLADVRDAVAAANVANVPVILTGCPELSEDELSENGFASAAIECLPSGCDSARFEFALLRAKYQVQRIRLEAFGRLDSARRPFIAPFITKAAPLERLAVRAEHSLFFLPVSEIEWVRSAGNYVWLHTATDRHKLRHTIAGLLTLLNNDRFVRVHRNAVVNLDRVVRFHVPGRGNAYALLHSGMQLPLSRGHGRALRQLKHC